MNSIINIILNYWLAIIIVGLIILMIIIGYYADQKKLVKPIKRKNKIEESKVENKKIDEPAKIEENVVKDNEEELFFADMPSSNDIVVDNKPVSDVSEVISKEEIKHEEDNVTNDAEQDFENFENEFDKIIPEKPVISDELKKYMDEFQIKPISMPTQKKEVSTNIELPEIKQIEKEEDIWKF